MAKTATLAAFASGCPVSRVSSSACTNESVLNKDFAFLTSKLYSAIKLFAASSPPDNPQIGPPLPFWLGQPPSL